MFIQCRHTPLLSAKGWYHSPPPVCNPPQAGLSGNSLRGGEMYIFELTVPLEPYVLSAHTRKTEKYAHFVLDIETHRVYVEPFDIGSRGFFSPENKTTLRLIHSFCKSTITFTTFNKNISTIAISSSYYIIINRNSADWDPDIRNNGRSFQ